MKIKAYVTDQYGKRLRKVSESQMQYKNTDAIEQQNHPGDVEAFLVNIHPDVEFQQVGGIGGAFTDASATVWANMPEDKRKELVKAYFDRESGIGYTLGRLSIASCDFSTEDYTYVKEGDMTLFSFDISHDKKAVFPLVKEAEKHTELTLFASPWSPPAYMKTNGMCIINIETCTWYYGYKSVYLSSLYTFFTCSWLDLFLSSPLKYGDERK